LVFLVLGRAWSNRSWLRAWVSDEPLTEAALCPLAICTDPCKRARVLQASGQRVIRGLLARHRTQLFTKLSCTLLITQWQIYPRGSTSCLCTSLLATCCFMAFGAGLQDQAVSCSCVRCVYACVRACAYPAGGLSGIPPAQCSM
jgi:hypothetical protein